MSKLPFIISSMRLRTLPLSLAGVLNVNNIRDMVSDEGIRRTVPQRIGERKAKIYQTVLITGGCLLFFGYLLLLKSH